ncbi:MAG: protein RfbP [Deltaproteobacteria bacterium]|nr:MAG: protein RfbP [Deltaproteobacteria bacterium]
MLRRSSTLTLDLQKICDLLITTFSFMGAYVLSQHFFPDTLKDNLTHSNYYLIMLLVIISWFIAFKWINMYMSYREQPFILFFKTVIKSCLMGMVLLSIALFYLRIPGDHRFLLTLFLFLNICMLTIEKFIILKTLEKLRTDGFNTRRILIIGSKKRAISVIQTIEAHKASGYKIMGCFEIDPDRLGQTVINGHKVIGVIDTLEAYCRNNIVDELIFAVPLKKIANGEQYFILAERMGIKVRIVPDWQLHYLEYRPNIGTLRIENFLGVYNMVIQSTPQNEGALLIKRAFDITFSLFCMLLLSPLLLGIAIAIRFYTKGPIFYIQERLGINGRIFKLYKFRTMIENADEMRKDLENMNEADGPVFKIKKDPRIIPRIGHFLRRTGLDELPQLLNVLQGKMSLVGPRPPIANEVFKYSVDQRRRLSMKPGITCLWQISPNRNDMSFEEWMQLDLKYIDTWSLFNDFVILFMTIRAVIAGEGR